MTRPFRRLLLLIALVGLVAGAAAPAAFASFTPLALASEEAEEEAEPVDEAPSGAFIDAPAGEDEGINPAWTYRFLVPTSLVLIAVVIAGTVIAYFVRVVRTRYTTVG